VPNKQRKVPSKQRYAQLPKNGFIVNRFQKNGFTFGPN
jgi:hypothetical protein